MLAGARSRGQQVQGLSCFASSERMAELAEALGLELLAPAVEALRWGTKEGSRQIFLMAGASHPAGSYMAVRSIEDLAAGLAELAREHGPGPWMIKINDGLGSGHGNALLDVQATTKAELMAGLRDRLRPMSHNVSRAEFLSHVQETGAVLERYLVPAPGGLAKFPSAIGYLAKDADGAIRPTPLGTHEQDIGPEHDFLGCSFPASSQYRHHILSEQRKILVKLAKIGVTGYVGIDFIALSAAGGMCPWTLSATEINLRQTGSTHPNGMVRAVVDGEWQPDGSLLDQVGREVVYTSTDNIISERYRGIPALRLVSALRSHPSLSYDPARVQGVVPHLWTTLEPFGKIGATVIGHSMADCRSQERAFASLLDRLADESRETGARAAS